MKKLLLLAILFAFFSMSFAANDVPVNDARQVAQNFLMSAQTDRDIALTDLVLTRTVCDAEQNALYYVFAVGEQGFVMVAATDAVAPILAYSLSDNYDMEHSNYLEKMYCENIKAARADVTASALKEWNFYRQAQQTRTSYIDKMVAPRMTSKWNQEPYYNNYCPAQDPFPYGSTQAQFHVPTGCVATAMAGLMHYYRHPVYGTGAANYQPIYVVRDGDNNPTDTIVYPLQYQDFNTEHNFEMMPNEISMHTGEVAELCWHAGISINIAYGPSSSSGYSTEAMNAFRSKWGYNPNAQIKSRSNYSATNWSKLIRDELDTRRIIYYSAHETDDPNVGHAFLLDGYQDFNNVTEIISHTDTTYTFDHVDTVTSVVYVIDTITMDTLETLTEVTYDSVFVETYSDTIVTLDTTFSHTMIHVNWGWGGYENGYFTFENGHVEGWGRSESAFINLYPAGDPEEPTDTLIRVRGTRGTISDGPGHKMYQPGTDRAWMISAPDAYRYRIKFDRMETEEGGDEVVIYKNGDLAQEVGRYSGHSLPSQLNIAADSVMVRFIANDNDIVDYGFVISYTATIPTAYCTEEVTISGSGIISDHDINSTDTVPYRPDTHCSWKILGVDYAYFSYPQIDLALGDYIEIYDITIPNKHKLLKRIDLYNWPEEDVFLARAHKIRVSFVSDNYIENNGFVMTYESALDIDDNPAVTGLNVYPNPANSVLNVDFTGGDGEVSLRIMDMTGRVLMQEMIATNGEDIHKSLNINNLSKGIYLLSVQGKNGKSVRKFIVE